jgi:hypothetical protein
LVVNSKANKERNTQMNTVTLWFLVMTQATVTVFPFQFTTRAKCEEASAQLQSSRAQCIKAEVVVKP